MIRLKSGQVKSAKKKSKMKGEKGMVIGQIPAPHASIQEFMPLVPHGISSVDGILKELSK